MILREFVVADELVQDLQHALVGVAQFAEAPLSKFVQASGAVGGDQQKARPHGQVRPRQQALRLPLQRPTKRFWVHQVYPHNEQDGGDRSFHVAAAKVIRGDLIKLLWWDGDGLCLFAKRLERGRFLWPQAANGTVSLTPAQLSMLLEGIDWRHPVRSGAAQMAV